jgi:hypothetical protein
MTDTPWRRSLEDSVWALRDAAREYRAALYLAESGAWSVELDRTRRVDGAVTLANRQTVHGNTLPIRPHDKALYAIGDAYRTLRDTLTRGYEVAAMAYAYGAAWATRQVLDGHAPTAVEFAGRDDGQLTHPHPLSIAIGTTDGRDVARWSGAAKLAAARERLTDCQAAGEYGEELASREYLADHEAGWMHEAWGIADGLPDAANAYGTQAEHALAFALNVVRAATP